MSKTKKKRTVFASYSIAFITILLISMACARGQEVPFECFAVSDLVRVFEDGYCCPAPQKTIEVFGIRNEYLSAQCVIKANQDIQKVTVSVSPLINAKSTVPLASSTVGWNFVGSIPIAENAPKFRKTDLIRRAGNRHVKQPRGS